MSEYRNGRERGPDWIGAMHAHVVSCAPMVWLQGENPCQVLLVLPGL